MKPILFLDIDGVLNTWTGNMDDINPDFPNALCRVPGAREFFLWADRTFEIRWLTAWLPGHERTMPLQFLQALSWLLGVDANRLAEIRSAPWWDEKTEGVRAVIGNSDREWVWLEDGLSQGELQWLAETGNMGRFLNVDCIEDIHALEDAHIELRSRFTGVNHD